MRQSIERALQKQLYDVIHSDGKTAKIVFHSASPCIYCTVDPITGESISFYCSTCHGTGKYEVATAYYAKGVVNTFINNTGFVLFGNELFNIVPEGKARITFWAEDILLYTHSQTGPTYLDSADSIYIDSRQYKIQDYQRSGYNNLSVIIANLDRIGKE